MNVAALYDVHGMPWALEAVLAELDADTIVFGGDLGGGPYDEETLALAHSVDAHWVRGNTEDDSLPLAVELDGVTYCHATPTDNVRLTTAATPDRDLVAMFGPYGTFVIGHTHHQFDRRVGDLRVINAGSIGMPYEDEVAAFWTLVADGEPEFRKTSFDIAAAIERIRASDWDGRDDFVAENVVVPFPRQAAIAVFEEQRSASA